MTTASTGTEPAPVSINQDTRLAFEWLGRSVRSSRRQDFHMPVCLYLDGRLDLQALEHAVNAVVQRHGSLRTEFTPRASPRGGIERAILDKLQRHDGWRESVFAQRVRSNVGVELRVHDATNADSALVGRTVNAAIQQEMMQPFTLGASPLLRVTVYRRRETQHLLLLVFHHLIADTWSVEVFLRDLWSSYRECLSGASAPASDLVAPVPFTEYAQRQRMALTDTRTLGRLSLWQERFQVWAQCGVTFSDLPVLRRDSRGASTRAGTQTVSIGSPLSRAVHAFCRERCVTPYMLWLSVLYGWCHLHTGREAIALWGVLANRTADTAAMIGWASEGRVIGNQVASGTSFDALVDAVRDCILELGADQHLPMAAIQHPFHNRSHPSLLGDDAVHLGVEVLSRGLSHPVSVSAGLRAVPMRVPYNHALRGNAVRVCVEAGAHLKLRCIYSKRTISRGGIRAMLRQLRQLVAEGVAAPQRPLGALATVIDAGRRGDRRRCHATHL